MVSSLVCLRIVAGAAFLSTAGGSSGSVEKMSPSVAVELTSLELTALSENRSEARAVLKVSNPLAARERVKSRLVLLVNGQEVGQGSSRSRRLRPHKPSAVEVELKVDRKRFLSALGGDFNAGMAIDAELSGVLSLSLPSGVASVPVHLKGRMGTDGARSGVFALPEGGGSLSPH